MPTTPFILDNRFLVEPNRNLVTDSVLQKESRLEARLMKLLCLLVEHRGQLVSRDMITREIWDDYGNADESLTQAVSYLRKILADEQKKLIETVPKKGYVLHTTFSQTITQEQDTPKDTGEPAKKPSKQVVGITAAILFVVLIVFLIVQPWKNKPAIGLDVKPDSEQAQGHADKAHRFNQSPDVLNFDSSKLPVSDSQRK